MWWIVLVVVLFVILIFGGGFAYLAKQSFSDDYKNFYPITRLHDNAYIGPKVLPFLGTVLKENLSPDEWFGVSMWIKVENLPNNLETKLVAVYPNAKNLTDCAVSETGCNAHTTAVRISGDSMVFDYSIFTKGVQSLSVKLEKIQNYFGKFTHFLFRASNRKDGSVRSEIMLDGNVVAYEEIANSQLIFPDGATVTDARCRKNGQGTETSIYFIRVGFVSGRFSYDLEKLVFPLESGCLSCDGEPSSSTSKYARIYDENGDEIVGAEDITKKEDEKIAKDEINLLKEVVDAPLDAF